MSETYNHVIPINTYAHDPGLGGASPNVDGAPAPRRNRASLAPRTYMDHTTDKTIDWQLQQAYAGLADLLKETE